ncbi:MAG: adenosine-specific kinase [Methanobacterium sp.]
MEFKTEIVKLEAPNECNLILGQSHFIKTVEDLHEAIINTVPGAEFGLAFSEASGDCLVRKSGNSEDLINLAARMMFEVGCGHSFLIFIKNAFPINVIQRINMVPEVVNLYCATANPVQVIIAETEQGRGILGVIDGFKPKGIENQEDEQNRKKLLRQFGYKF